jgi:hypothetical protein
MATAKKPVTKTRSANKPGSAEHRSARSSTTDAIKLLTADHREVKALFQEYQHLVDHEADDDEKQAVSEQVCRLLSVHAQIEEELFYPEAKAAIKEPDLVDEADVEHAIAKALIAQIESGDPRDELYDAKVKVLGEYIDHHVKEEEGELFPQARRAKLDLDAIGQKIVERKSALLAQMGDVEEPEAADASA